MFKVGDKVTIRHHSQEEKYNYETDWGARRSYWRPHMDTMEGKPYIIDEIAFPGYYIRDHYGTWRFAEHSLVSLYEQF